MYKKNLSCRPFQDKNKRTAYLCKSIENFQTPPNPITSIASIFDRTGLGISWLGGEGTVNYMFSINGINIPPIVDNAITSSYVYLPPLVNFNLTPPHTLLITADSGAGQITSDPYTIPDLMPITNVNATSIDINGNFSVSWTGSNAIYSYMINGNPITPTIDTHTNPAHWYYFNQNATFNIAGMNQPVYYLQITASAGENEVIFPSVSSSLIFLISDIRATITDLNNFSINWASENGTLTYTYNGATLISEAPYNAIFSVDGTANPYTINIIATDPNTGYITNGSIVVDTTSAAGPGPAPGPAPGPTPDSGPAPGPDPGPTPGPDPGLASSTSAPGPASSTSAPGPASSASSTSTPGPVSSTSAPTPSLSAKTTAPSITGSSIITSIKNSSPSEISNIIKTALNSGTSPTTVVYSVLSEGSESGLTALVNNPILQGKNFKIEPSDAVNLYNKMSLPSIIDTTKPFNISIPSVSNTITYPENGSNTKIAIDLTVPKSYNLVDSNGNPLPGYSINVIGGVQYFISPSNLKGIPISVGTVLNIPTSDGKTVSFTVADLDVVIVPTPQGKTGAIFRILFLALVFVIIVLLTIVLLAYFNRSIDESVGQNTT